MRVGQNPAKLVREVAKPARVTVAVLNYIPFLNGFYAQMLDVLKACLEGIWQNTDMPYDLMVFDNGSCPEVVQYLLDCYEQGKIQYLLLSQKNLGKGGAWNQILGGAPGELIAYLDNDCLFFKGWLSRSVDLLETYPNVGMVTARPFRTNAENYTSTLAWAQKAGVPVEQGQLVPVDTINEFNRSLGQSEEQLLEHLQSTQDIRLTYQGVQAYVGASHWQFLARKDVLAQFLPFNMDRPMGQVKQLDQRLNAAGYLRLMPTEPLAMNMSNTVALPERSSAKAGRKKISLRRRIFEMPVFKKPLLAFYDWVFNVYYKE